MATVRRLSAGDRVFYIGLYALLGLFCFSTLFPFVNFLVLSFNDGQDTLRGGVYLWPRVFTMDNYKKAFEDKNILNSFRITVLRTLLTTGISVLLTAMMAYGLSIKGLPGRRGIVFYFFLTTLFSGGLIPTYVLYRQLGLLNNFWVLVVPGLFSFYNTIVMKTFFDGISPSLSESARIDGASELSIFLRILLPLSAPVLATISLFVGVGAWNDWFSGAFYINFNEHLVPASTLLYKKIAEASFESAQLSGGSNVSSVNEALMAQRISGTTPESLRMTFVIIIITPIILVYPFLQRYFVKGIMVGSLKE
ncbi:MAG: carbohydrate ABC transporter permease [Clostridiales bacterium]|nr:carbohydrate ABC transporter permease [Clostridiales bacterium]